MKCQITPLWNLVADCMGCCQCEGSIVPALQLFPSGRPQRSEGQIVRHSQKCDQNEGTYCAGVIGEAEQIVPHWEGVVLIGSIDVVEPRTTPQVHALTDRCMENAKKSCPDSNISSEIAGYGVTTLQENIPGTDKQSNRQQDQRRKGSSEGKAGDEVRERTNEIEGRYTCSRKCQ